MARRVQRVNRLSSKDHVIVVGAGLAGWRLVQSLRRVGYEGAITLVGDEPHAPYDRPPLSKQVLAGKWAPEKATLASKELLLEADVETRLGARATALDVASMSVHLNDGSVVAGTHVALATGSRARPLSFSSSGPLATLRNIDDVRDLSGQFDALSPASVVAVIGGGFVGAEVATSAKARGLTPVVLEAAVRPLIGVLGEVASSWLESLASDAGIELRTHQQLLDVETREGGADLRFEDGSTLHAGAVLAAVGSVIDVAWLDTSGLTLDDGVVVDEHLQAAPNVAALGDVARFLFRNAAGEELVRIEHWQVAADHATQLAHYWVLGENPPAPMIPYFWSDQYGQKIQMLGHPRPSDDVALVSGGVASRKWLALYSRDGQVTGIVTLNQPRALMLTKVTLDEPTTLAEALARAPWAN